MYVMMYYRLKCSLLNQRTQPVAGQRLAGARTRRQIERRLDNTPYARHQYQPFQWPGAVASSTSTSSSSGVAINENMSGVMAARNASSVHQLRHKPRTRAATAAAAASLGDVGESLFPGLSSSLPPLPPVVGSSSSMTAMASMSMSMLPDAVSMTPVDALPPALDNGTSSMMSSSSGSGIKYESSPSPSFAPFSPSAGFMDMRDFQLPMSPYSTASAFDDGVSVKSEESSRFDEIDEVDEDEDAPAHVDDAALAVAAVLVRAHEAGYEMDSLTTQIQIALLK